MKLPLLLAFFICCFQTGYSQPGSLDQSFGKNGVVRTDIGSNVSNPGTTRQVFSQSDGSIFVVFESNGTTSIAKKRPDGSPDSSYGTAGFSASVTIKNTHAAMQKDGKIVVAGTGIPSGGATYGYGNTDFILARYNTDGSIDYTFDKDGKLSTDFNAYIDAVSSIVIQNEKIVVAGHSTNPYDPNYDPDNVIGNVSISRYNVDGSLDNTFNGTGKLITQLQSRNVQIAVQADGKIVVDNLAGSGLNLIRYNSGGSVDTTFKFTSHIANSNGSVFISTSLAVQNNGKTVVGGYWKNTAGNNDFALARFNANGSIDNTFDTDGIQTTDFRMYNDVVNTVAIQSDGKIVAVGYASNGSNYAFAIARYNTNGSADNTFDTDGKKMNFITSNNIFAVSLAIAGDGKLVAGGYEQTATKTNIAIIRYNADGSLDNTFNRSGTLIDNVKQKNTVFTSSAAQKDGKVVAAGYAWNGTTFDFAVARYNTDGSLDNSFSSDGIQLTDIGSSDNKANAVAIQADGKIVVAGYASNGTNDDFAVVRYNTDGSLDKSFSSDGMQTTDFGYIEVANALAIQSNGKIVVAGALYEHRSDDYKAGLARYNTDGSLDNTFSEDGKQESASDLYGVSIDGIAIQSDGKIVVAGTANYNVMVARYNTNGSLDSAFGYNGITEFAIPSDQDGSFTYGYSVNIQKDGKIIVGAENGYFDKGGKHSDILIARFNSDGSLDKSFSQDGYVELLYSTDNASVSLQDDGKIVVASNRYDYINYGYDDFEEIRLGFVLARLTNNGTPDSTFGLNSRQYIPNSENIRILSTTIANNKLYTVGYGINISNYGFLARFNLAANKAPIVKITSPANNAAFTAPANITVNAAASDTDGTVYSVKFYNGTTYLKTDFTSPYSYTISNLPAGTYSITAKATDNAGAQTISAAVTVVVKAPNQAPSVTITSPANNAAYAAPANVTVNVLAADADGTIQSVKFYNGTTYLKTDFTNPYSYTIANLPAGTYSITAKATDNNGAQTISAPVTVTVSNATIVSNKPINNKTGIKEEISVKLSPNPATNIVNIYASGLKPNKPADISIISISGIVLKKVQSSSAAQTQLDVSSLAKGVYTIRIVSGEKVMYKQFVKL